MHYLATAKETSNLSARHQNLEYRNFSPNGLQLSSVGFGGYRIHPSIDLHRQALRQALLSGVNVIDTSSNYTDGGSETLIGEVLAELAAAGHLRRNEIFVMTKGGYLQGQNYEHSQQLKKQGRPFPGLVEYAAGLEHCIHPEFLEWQIGESLKRLGLPAVDCFLLHNPEYFLQHARHIGLPLPEARSEYYQRIKHAFMQLEQEVRNGRIGCYGISSNTFPYPAGHFSFTSVEQVWQAADSISPDHHFKAIQAPFNLFESGLATEKNLSGQKTTLTFCREKNLAVFVNRPLNALLGRRLFRLADIHGSLETDPEKAYERFNDIIRLENYFEKELSSFISGDDLKKDILENLATGSYLAVNWQQLGPYHAWIDSNSRVIVSRVSHALEQIAAQPVLSDDIKHWLDEYSAAFNETVDEVTNLYKRQSVAENNELKKILKAAAPLWDEARGLSGKALRALRSTAGITSVLVGMRHPEYVQDVLQEAENQVPAEDNFQTWSELTQKLPGFLQE